jgi:hypothetical protein
MATNVQRAQSILEALLNGPSTAAQRQRMLAAYGFGLAAGSTNEQIAAAFIAAMRNSVITTIRDYESAAAFDAARNAAFSQAMADFPQAP